MTVHGERVFMLFRFHVKKASGSGAWSCAIFSAIVCTSDKLFITPSPKYIKQSGLPCNSLHNPCKFLHIFFFRSPFSALPFPIFRRSAFTCALYGKFLGHSLIASAFPLCVIHTVCPGNSCGNHWFSRRNQVWTVFSLNFINSSFFLFFY